MYDGTSVVGSILSAGSYHASLLARHAGAKSFPGRENYIGASEVGSCMRLVAMRKLHPESNIVEPDSAGRMRAGQVMEGEIVQIVRGALGNSVRETGHNQAELSLPDAPVRVHPDGRLLGSILDPLRWSRVPVLLASGSRIYLDPIPDQDGALEIKTASSHQLRKFRNDGLPLVYQDQTQIQMGAMGVSWGLAVVVSRENLADHEVFFLQFDPTAFEAAKDRARSVMAVVERIRDGVCSEDALPLPETERGYCSSCLLADSCPAMITARAAAGSANVIPPDEVDDFEAMVEEYCALQPDAKRFDAVKDLLKERAIACGIEKASLPSGTIISLSERQGRESTNTKALKTQFPEVAAKLISRGDPYFILSVKEAL